MSREQLAQGLRQAMQGLVLLLALGGIAIIILLLWPVPHRAPPGPALTTQQPAPPPAEMPAPQPQPAQPVEQKPASDSQVATKRADKLSTPPRQEPRIEGAPPFHARVERALTLLRERVPTGYLYVLHLNFIREGKAAEMHRTLWGKAMAQTVNCGHLDAGAILGPDDLGAVRDAAVLAHEGAHIALRLCGPNAHADGRVYAVDLLVRHDLEDAGLPSYASFSRKVIAAEAGQ